VKAVASDGTGNIWMAGSAGANVVVRQIVP
jgi:hypothetical protein